MEYIHNIIYQFVQIFINIVVDIQVIASLVMDTRVVALVAVMGLGNQAIPWAFQVVTLDILAEP